MHGTGLVINTYLLSQRMNKAMAILELTRVPPGLWVQMGLLHGPWFWSSLLLGPPASAGRVPCPCSVWGLSQEGSQGSDRSDCLPHNSNLLWATLLFFGVCPVGLAFPARHSRGLLDPDSWARVSHGPHCCA